MGVVALILAYLYLPETLVKAEGAEEGEVDEEMCTEGNVVVERRNTAGSIELSAQRSGNSDNYTDNNTANMDQNNIKNLSASDSSGSGRPDTGTNSSGSGSSRPATGTNSSGSGRPDTGTNSSGSGSSRPDTGTNSSGHTSRTTFRELLRHPNVAIYVGGYFLISLMAVVYDEVIPLWCQSSIQRGGLEYTSREVGEEMYASVV